MRTNLPALAWVLLVPAGCWAAPAFPQVNAAVTAALNAHDVAGAVTVIATKDAIVHLDARGLADIASGEPMRPTSLFWIASMTKPVTAVAVLLLQDEGRLDVTAPVATYLPEFAALRTPSGRPARITLAQLLTHTSGLGEAPDAAAIKAHTLADLVALYLAAPMQFEPGAKWKFCQAGINTAARVVEVVSGMSFDAFVRKRILVPLEMNDTTFYPGSGQVGRPVTVYAKNPVTGVLDPASPRSDVGHQGDPPFGNMGLYSTGPDYARFCQMLLRKGTVGGRTFLSPNAIKLLTTIQTGTLPSGFFQSTEYGSRGSDYGWGLGMCILRTPHGGVDGMLSAGSFGHGGGWGTQAWIDPVRGVAYVLMVQRSNFGNSDNSNLRRTFQQAGLDALNGRVSADPAPVATVGAKTALQPFILDGLGHPRCLVVDRAGNIYVADANSAAVRKITPSGEIAVLGGSQASVIKDPTGLALGRDGTVFVADADDDMVYRISPSGSVVALSQGAGAAQLRSPTSVAVDSHGSVFVTNNGSNTILKITPEGIVTVFAGQTGSNGDVDGIGNTARFNAPRGIAIDGNDNLYVVDVSSPGLNTATMGGVKCSHPEWVCWSW
jgi:CubicO group peptidase (beta-lactamase class C family)